MDRETRQACYRLLAELLTYPEARDREALASWSRRVARAPQEVRGPLNALLARPEIEECEAFVQTLELAPACPLYLGHYRFPEPESCRGVASSPRNDYLIELLAIYRHFGLVLEGRELPDFLPVVLEFLALSLDRPERDRGGLRTRLLDHHVRPALPAMAERFAERGGPWALALEAFEALLASEPQGAGDSSESAGEREPRASGTAALAGQEVVR